MKVFLDTNVFYNNWYCKNVNLKLLFFFLNNEKFELLLSKLVVSEVNNIRERKLNEVTEGIKTLIKQGSKLNHSELIFPASNLGISPYDVSSVISEKVHWIEFIDYCAIEHETVVTRAMKSIRPFTVKEKGYRDTLIWLSFLAYLKQSNVEGDVAFISNNKSDFFDVKSKELSFNSDLKNDLHSHAIKANVIPYLNVYDFVNKNVDKLSHSFDREELLDSLEDFLISETEAHVEGMSNSDLSSLFDSRVFVEKLTSVVEINAEVYEGLEDPVVKNVLKLSNTSVYVGCSFEMRILDLAVTIDAVEYKQYADDLEAIKSLYNIELDDDYAKLSFVIRLCIDGSFEYKSKEDQGNNLSIDHIAIRNR